MKRWLALFFALLLPCSALAEDIGIIGGADGPTVAVVTTVPSDEVEAYRLTMDISVGEGYKSLLSNTYSSLLADDMAMASLNLNMDALGELVQKIANGSGLDVTFARNGLSLVLRVGGQRMLDGSAFFPDDGSPMIITSSLMGKAALTGKKTFPAMQPRDIEALEETVNQLLSNPADWMKVAQDVSAAFLSGVEKKTEQGFFMGDAYQGGTYRETYSFTDQDLSRAVNVLLMPEAQEMLLPVLEELLGADGAHALFQLVRSLKMALAGESGLHYTISLVRENESQPEPMGLDIEVCMDSGAKIASISLGQSAGKVQMICGIGLPEYNQWISYTYEPVVTGEDGRGEVNTTSRNWIDSERKPFMAVAEDESKLVSESIATTTITLEADGTRLQKGSGTYRMKNQWYNGKLMPIDLETMTCTETRRETFSPYTLDTTYELRTSTQQLLTSSHATLAPTEALSLTLDSLTLYDVDDDSEENQEALYKLERRVSSMLMARLFKIIPMDIYQLILNMDANPSTVGI